MGLDKREVRDIITAATLHDIGKVGIPDGILNKPDKLSDIEFEKIKEHPLLALDSIRSIKRLRNLVDIVKLFVQNNGVKRIHIATNGLLPDLTVRKTQEMLAILGKDARLTMQFSIDGFEAKHDEVRGMKGAFQKTCETVKRLGEIHDERLAVSVATVVH